MLGLARVPSLLEMQQLGVALADQYGYRVEAGTHDEKPGLIINVTPIGMAGAVEADDAVVCRGRTVRGAEVIFDVVAQPAETPLIRLAESLGKKTISGADVIVLQAVEQFVLYTGVRPEQEAIDRAAVFARGNS
jgi:shikimate dehydrogenase